MYLELTPELEKALPRGQDPFEWFLDQQGQAHREVKHRLTYEALVGNQHIFVKRHLGCGWSEVLKEWYRLRKPVVSARTEWEGAEILQQAGLRVPSVLGKGERGQYPHKMESFVVLEALEVHETLEHFKPGWLGLTGSRWVALKRALIAEVSRMCRTMHACGINHRDLYINHFLISRDYLRSWASGKPLPLYLIDLHRVQQRPTVPRRWLMKDLSSLLFSALDIGLSSTDCVRFLSAYLGADWRKQLSEDREFWRKILKRAVHLYTGYHGQGPRLPKLIRNALNHG